MRNSTPMTVIYKHERYGTYAYIYRRYQTEQTIQKYLFRNAYPAGARRYTHLIRWLAWSHGNVCVYIVHEHIFVYCIRLEYA